MRHANRNVFLRPARWLGAKRDRTILAAIGASWLLAYVLLVRPISSKGNPSWLSRADGTWMYLQIRSLILEHTTDFRKEYEHVGFVGSRPKWKIWLGTTRAGQPNDPWTIGTGLCLSPFFVVGHALARVVGARGPEPTLLEQYVTFSGSVVYGFLGLLLVFRTTRRRFGSLSALLGTVGVLLTSPVFFFTTYYASYSHGISFFCSALLLELWDSKLRPRHNRTGGAPRPAYWAAYGAATGLAALVRPQLVLLGLPGAITWIRHLWTNRRRPTAVARLVLSAFLTGALAVLVFTPQMWIWHEIYGRYLLVPQGSWFMQWRASQMWEVLFAARSGLFPHSPVLLVAALGWVLWARTRPVDLLVFGGLVLIMAYVNGAAWDYWAGGTYGARRMTCVVPFFMVGAGGLVAWIRDMAARRPALVGWVAAACLFLPFLSFAQWEMHAIARDGRMSSHWPNRDMAKYGCTFLKSIQKSVGNPFEWPRSIPLWLTEGLPPGLYSRVTTDLPLDWPPPWMAPGAPTTKTRAHLDLTAPRWSKFIRDGARLAAEPGRRQPKLWVATGPCIRLFLPLRIPYRYRVVFEVAPHATSRMPEPHEFHLLVNGRNLGPGKQGPRTRHRTPFRLERLSWLIPERVTKAGLNHLTLCGPSRTYALKSLVVSYVRPSPKAR